jgi:hypothetical protein
MHKPYVYLYSSCAILFTMGYLLMTMWLATKLAGAPKGTSISDVLDFRDSITQVSSLLMFMGIYHFILGVKVDRSMKNLCQDQADLSNEMTF